MKFEQKKDFVEVTFTENAQSDEEQVKLAKKYLAKFQQLFKKYPDKKFNILINVQRSAKVNRDIHGKATSLYDKVTTSSHVHKVAVLGDSKFTEIIVNLIFFRFKEKKVNWFTDRKKALLWLGVVE